MDATKTLRRYRLVTRYGKTMAQVEDTGHRDFGVRGLSIAVTRLMDYADAHQIMESLEAKWQAEKAAKATIKTYTSPGGREVTIPED